MNPGRPNAELKPENKKALHLCKALLIWLRPGLDNSFAGRILQGFLSL
jgi:hypothetical protein